MKILKNALFTVVAIVFVAWLVAIVKLQLETHEYHELTLQEAAQAAAYLDGKVPDIPPGWQWKMFSPEPGVELRTGVVDVEDAKGTIVFVPGFTGSLELAMGAIAKLNESGYRVAGIEYRGQGKSWRPLTNPEKGYVKSYAELASDVALFAKDVRIDTKPLFFFSISKGAHITMRMAAETGIDADAYALVVPMIRINSGDLSYAGIEFIANTLSNVGLGAMYAPGQSQWPPKPLVFGEANGCNANPETAQLQSAVFAQNKALRTRGTTVQWLNETIASSKKLQSADFMQAVVQPVKIFTAGDDRLVDTDAANEFCDALAQCQTIHYEKARHCINRESPERMDRIIAEAIELFDRVAS